MTCVNFDRAADFYDATRGFPPGVSEQVSIALVDNLPKNARLLEIGIGTGRISLPLLKHGMRVNGIDLSTRMMAHLLQSMPEGSATIGLAQADATHLPFAPAVFDGLLAVHVLHLIAGWKTAMLEARRVLTPHGVFALGLTWRSDESPRSRIRNHFDQILHAMGAPKHQRVGMHDVSELDVEMEALGIQSITEITAAEWDEMHAISDVLESLEKRTWSSTWGAPDEIYTAAIARLRRWVEHEYGDLERQYHHPHKFFWRFYRL